MIEKPKIIVVGAGISGMTAALYLVSQDVKVNLVCNLPLNSASSGTCNDGFNAVLDTNSCDDSITSHIQDTILFGDNLADPFLVKKICEMAPKIVNVMQRMGVRLNQTLEGRLKTRQMTGSSFARSLDSKVSLGQQILQCLKQQVYYHVSKGHINLYQGWEFLSLVLDKDQCCRGIIAQQKTNMKMGVFKSDAVVIATGDMTALYGKYSVKGLANTGSAISQIYKQGAFLANCEYTSFYPYAILSKDKSFKIHQDLITDKKQLWFEKERSPFYFLDDWYGEPLSQMTDAFVMRAISKLPHTNDNGYDLIPDIYLDLRPHSKTSRFKQEEEMIKIYAGVNPSDVSINIKPAIQSTQGGLWTDQNQMTNLKGVFAIGDCSFQFHGANPLPGNTLLALWASGELVSKSCKEYINAEAPHKKTVKNEVFTRELQKNYNKIVDYLDLSGPENIYSLYEKLSSVLYKYMGPVQKDDEIQKVILTVKDLKERLQRISVTDKGKHLNDEVFFINSFDNMLDLAEAMALSALQPDESQSQYDNSSDSTNDNKTELGSSPTQTKFMPEGYQNLFKVRKVSFKSRAGANQ